MKPIDNQPAGPRMPRHTPAWRAHAGLAAALVAVAAAGTAAAQSSHASGHAHGPAPAAPAASTTAPAAAGASAAKPANAAAESAGEWADAEVRRVDREARKVTLRHGPIRSLDMPPMTMVFQVADDALLARLREGGKVRFMAEKRAGAYVVTQVEPAP